MEYLDVDGQRIEYLQIGTQNAAGPTLVFLHHGLGCVTTWRDFPEKICKASGLPGFIYSRAGYGGSESVEWPRPANYLNNEATDVLPKVLVAAGITDFILVGHSDGASISLVHAGTSENGPRAVIVLAAHLFVEQSNLDAISETRQEYEEGDLRQKLKKHHGENVDCAYFGWRESWLLPEFKQWQIFDLVPKISCPVLAIRGKLDEYGSPLQIEKLRELMTTGLQVLEPECGHFPHQEAFEDVSECVLAFLKEYR